MAEHLIRSNTSISLPRAAGPQQTARPTSGDRLPNSRPPSRQDDPETGRLKIDGPSVNAGADPHAGSVGNPLGPSDEESSASAGRPLGIGTHNHCDDAPAGDRVAAAEAEHPIFTPPCQWLAETEGAQIGSSALGRSTECVVFGSCRGGGRSSSVWSPWSGSDKACSPSPSPPRTASCGNGEPEPRRHRPTAQDAPHETFESILTAAAATVAVLGAAGCGSDETRSEPTAAPPITGEDAIAAISGDLQLEMIPVGPQPDGSFRLDAVLKAVGGSMYSPRVDVVVPAGTTVAAGALTGQQVVSEAGVGRCEQSTDTTWECYTDESTVSTVPMTMELFVTPPPEPTGTSTSPAPRCSTSGSSTTNVTGRRAATPTPPTTPSQSPSSNVPCGSKTLQGIETALQMVQ